MGMAYSMWMGVRHNGGCLLVEKNNLFLVLPLLSSVK